MTEFVPRFGLSIALCCIIWTSLHFDCIFCRADFAIICIFLTISLTDCFILSAFCYSRLVFQTALFLSAFCFEENCANVSYTHAEQGMRAYRRGFCCSFLKLFSKKFDVKITSSIQCIFQVPCFLTSKNRIRVHYSFFRVTGTVRLFFNEETKGYWLYKYTYSICEQNWHF